MNQSKIILLLVLCMFSFFSFAQDDEEDYVEFNDRKNVVHGVYIGLTTAYGQVHDKNTYQTGLKIAYVANRQFEIGFATNGFFTELEAYNSNENDFEALVGGYAGLHLEPIFFGKSVVSVSVPMLIGVGAVGYINENWEDDMDVELSEDDVDAIFIFEPGMSVLFNISRYLQIEASGKYRFSSRIDLYPNSVPNISGWSAGIGVKVGVFNMGRNRYKKNIID